MFVLRTIVCFQYIATNLHGVTPQKAVLLLVTTFSTPYLTGLVRNLDVWVIIT